VIVLPFFIFRSFLVIFIFTDLCQSLVFTFAEHSVIMSVTSVVQLVSEEVVAIVGHLIAHLWLLQTCTV